MVRNRLESMTRPWRRLAFLVALASSEWAASQPQGNPPTAEPSGLERGQGLPDFQLPPRVLGAWLGHVESNNLSRTAAERDGSYEAAGLVLGLGRDSTRLDASISADLEYREYSLDELDNEIVGILSAAAEIDVIQDHFSWAFSDDFGQGLTDPFGGTGPVNREGINVIGTGPRLALPLGTRMSVELRGTYLERRFDESGDAVDSDSLVSELGLYRQTSATSRFGIVASTNDVEYVDVLAPEYQIDRLSLRYEKQLATGRVVADLGENDITSLGVARDEPLYNFLWTRSLTSRSELTIRAARELTDSGGVLGAVLEPEPQGSSFAGVLVIPNPLEQRRLDVSYVLTMSRTVISADVGSWKGEYIGNQLYDNDTTAMRLSFIRTISPTLVFGVGYNDIDRDFVDSAGAEPDSEDSWTAAWINRSFGRRLNLGLAISNYD